MGLPVLGRLGRWGKGEKCPRDNCRQQRQCAAGVGILLGCDDGALAEAGGQIIRTDLMDLPTLQKICERGRELRIKVGTLSRVADGGEYIVEHAAPRLLDDVLAVFTGDEARLWFETVVTRLAEANPDAYDG